MHFKSIVHACMNKDEHGFFLIHITKKKKKKKEQLSNASKQRKQK
jgi:hypothetical protein